MDNTEIADELVKLAGKMVAMKPRDVKENVRFYDPARHQEGKLVTRKYHQTTLWMMLYDDGTIDELMVSDLRRIQKI